MTTQLVRSAYFQCTHFYKVDSWSDEKNREEFGLCFHPQGHGHTYKVDLYLEGQVDPTSGMIMNLWDVDQGIKKVLQHLDQKHLNFDIPEFQNRNDNKVVIEGGALKPGLVPTTENIAEYLFKLFKEEIHSPTCAVVRLRLYESEDLWVDYGKLSFE